jgi:transmembrane sensor
MSETALSKLIEKYKNGTLTEEESAFLNAWYIKYAIEQESSFDPAYLDQNQDLMWNAIEDNVAQHGFRSERLKPAAKTSLWPRIAAAASVIMVMGAALYFFNANQTTVPGVINIAKTDIKPGGNRAFLTLADGSKISLNDAANGKLANQAGITITKTKNGQLIYTIADQQSAKPGNLYNTIETPRGGQYQINLPDGSKVWLNAETKLKFPVTFANKKERKVELSGEAYFEVAKLKAEGVKMPFIVASTGQEVEVLGTHFNVNAYPDEQDTKTTLLEGLVRVSGLLRPRNTILKPGQQSSLTPTGLSLKNVDTEQAVAWKNGQFMFSNEPLTQVMKEVSRWYNVEVEYQGDFSNVVIGGSVSKFSNIKEVLDVLALAGKVSFKTVGNKVIVSP